VDQRLRHWRRPRHGNALVVILGVVALMASACGSPANATSATRRTTTTTSTTAPTQRAGGFLTPEVKYGTGVVGAPEPTTSVPTERGTRSIDPTNDAGQEVIIAKGGYLLPQWLVADVSLPITWTNLSGAPQQIVFDDAPLHSPVIVPGGTFTWTSPGYGVGLTYHTVGGHEGRLTLQNPNNAP
jgi:hypothetical protein